MIKSETPNKKQEEVVLIYIQEYLGRVLNKVEKEVIYQHGGLVNVEQRIVILPWINNQKLKINQKQADILEVIDLIEKMPFTRHGGYIARVQYEK